MAEVRQPVPVGTAEYTMSRAMAYHTFTSLLYHCVFSTKNRQPSIPKNLLPRLWPYMGGIARTNGMKALAIGGMNDHAHLALSAADNGDSQSSPAHQIRLFPVDA